MSPDDFNPDLPILSLNNFLFDKEKKIITAMASDFGHCEWLGHLFYDGFEQGIAIHSPKTGKVEYFRLHQRLMDNEENEVQGWEFFPVHQLPKLKKVIIFND